LRFFEQVKQGAYDIFISDIVLEEIAKASEKKRELLLGLIAEYQPQKLEINQTILNLAEKRIFSARCFAGSCRR